MKTIIKELEKKRCQEYLDRRLSNWADFTGKIIVSNITETGKFFCLVPAGISNVKLYEFDFAKGMNISKPYAQNVVISFLQRCFDCEDLKSPVLRAKDATALSACATSSSNGMFKNKWWWRG